jgi:hypothetical protein
VPFVLRPGKLTVRALGPGRSMPAACRPNSPSDQVEDEHKVEAERPENFLPQLHSKTAMKDYDKYQLQYECRRPWQPSQSGCRFKPLVPRTRSFSIG